MKLIWRVTLLILLMLGALLALWMQPPIAQPLAYHNFADQRLFWSIPNFFDVASNLPFLWVGFIGVQYCWNHRQPQAPLSWLTLFVGVALVSVGSAYYHWNPNNATLVWDRLPMTVGFMGLFVALLSEYTNPKLEKYALFPAVVLGVTSVIYWHLFNDLRPYIWVQLAPILAIPLLLILFESSYTHQGYLLAGLGLYGLAKAFEHFDTLIFAYTGSWLSGHTLKHLSAAASIYVILRMLRLRHSKKV